MISFNVNVLVHLFAMKDCLTESAHLQSHLLPPRSSNSQPGPPVCFGETSCDFGKGPTINFIKGLGNPGILVFIDHAASRAIRFHINLGDLIPYTGIDEMAAVDIKKNVPRNSAPCLGGIVVCSPSSRQ